MKLNDLDVFYLSETLQLIEGSGKKFEKIIINKWVVLDVYLKDFSHLLIIYDAYLTSFGHKLVYKETLR